MEKSDNCLFWDSLFGDAVSKKPLRTIDLPVVIMAGGKGTRMDPFTKILPKPLLPIGDKTVVEMIIESFVEYGIKRFLFVRQLQVENN